MECSMFNIKSEENGMCADPVMALTMEGTSRSVEKNKKSRAEIQREYRKRKAQAKKLKEANELSEHKKVKKTKAEIQKEYRKRKAEAKKLKEANGLSAVKKVKKTKAEIQREYRKRKAEAKKLMKSKELPECKKTRAEIQREYRKRKKIERLVKERKILFEEDLSAELAKKPKLCDLTLANAELKKRFICNPFGFACNICDRLCFEKDLKGVGMKCYNLLSTEFPNEDITTFKVCVSCQLSLFAGRIPILSRSHGFIYPKYPNHLPPLNCLEERLISPVIPFRQIRRARRITDSKKILGQIINVPVDESTKVQSLPRELEDDYAINVHVKRMQIYKSSHLLGFINKGAIKQWLEYLSNQPLYRNIVINKEFFSCEKDQIKDEGLIENLNPENDSEVLMAQQHSLMWKEDKYLSLALGEKNTPLNIICDEFVEELSFPSIYLGQARIFTCDVTAFQVATSEIRRQDRRGVTPEHILYLAMKIMRLRIIQGVKDTFKAAGDAPTITRKMIEDKQFIEQCVDLNIFTFLQTIPNSVQCWVQRKKDLFAMIRQLGKPTAFLTLSSSEYKWSQLLKILYKLKYGREFEGDPIELMSTVERCTLVNEDPVCCVLHFDKLIDTILCILQSSTCSPFGKYRVLNFFKCIEFSHRGSVHARILLWLENDPKETIGEDMPETIKLINELCTVNTDQLKTSKQNQTHQHTFTCYKKNKKCMFGAPFWPINETRIFIPLSKNDGRREQYKKKYVDLKFELETEDDHSSLSEFLSRNNIKDYDEYLNIIRAGIHQPVVMLKRSIKEKWVCNFNPWIASILNSNMDLQLILDEYSCAAYIVEYVNKTKRGISDLHHQLNTIRVEYPDKDYADLLMQVGIQMLNSIEMSSQEAAWYLLRLGMSESSCKVEYIPTVMPPYRQRVKKKTKDIDEDSCNIWKEGTMEKYEKRPEELNEVSLAQFVSLYNKTSVGTYKVRKDPKIIHWRNYDMIEDMDNYKREMVTLFHPFRNEMLDILDNNKYLEIFDKYELRILEVKKKFHSDVDIEKIMEECERLCIEKEQEEEKKDQFLKIRQFQEESI